MSQHRIVSRRDLDFMLYDWLDAASLTSRPRFADHSRETFAAALDTSEALAAKYFVTHNRKADLNEPHMKGDRVALIPEVKQALDAFSEAGFMAAAHDHEFGGMQLPCVVEKACFGIFKGANVGTAAYALLTIAAANLLLAHGTRAQVDAFARPMLAGRFFGTMCLSEPQAGSSLADITTRAEPHPDGTYRLFGNKMWISGGEHDLAENIVHMVLAKIPGGPPGTKGISLFAVPRVLVNDDGSLGARNDVSLAGLNHKMGYRGTVNCLMNFGEGSHAPGGAPGAVGYRVGAEHQGLACMFHMMNEARIGVGLGAAMLGYTGYLHALDYARGRPQGRGVRARDPAAPQVPIIEHPDVRRMLLAQKAYAEGGLALNLFCARLVDEERTGESPASRREAAGLLELLTPIAKSWPSQWCVEGNSLAIQVHGGYGYTRDYPVEQFYRDNRLNPIHEGTHGIQALDLLGRKVTQRRGEALMLLAARATATLEAARATGDAELAGFGDALMKRVARVGEVTAALFAGGDVERALANASVYLEALGHVVVAWIWLEQCVAVVRAGLDDDFARGKRQAGRYFFAWELPKVDAQLDLLASLDATTLEMRDAWF